MGFAKQVLCPVLLCAALGSVATAQQPQDSVPNQPFRTVHLLKLTPAQEAPYKAALQDFNRVFVKEGCVSCAYRLSKAEVSSGGPYNFMLVARWPGRAVYMKLHDSPAYAEAARKNPIFAELEKSEFYGRFVDAR